MTTSSAIPPEIQAYLEELDAFIDREIKPLQASNDNERFFDYRREWARTDFEKGAVPRKEWEELLAEARRRADRAGHLRFGMPRALGGKDGSNLALAIIWEHLAAKGLGLHNDLQNESSIVSSNPLPVMLHTFGSEKQKREILPGIMNGTLIMGFGLTEPRHGSDATWMETKAVRSGNGWSITGEKMWNTGLHVATHDLIFARTSGKAGDSRGITAFIVPTNSPGFEIGEFTWTFNLPTDHAKVALRSVWVPDDAILGDPINGLAVAGIFLHHNRMRQAASSLGAAQYCINQSIKYAKERKPFGKPLSTNQAIQWPIVHLQTEAEMTRLLIRATAAEMDTMTAEEVARKLSHKVAMCNYRANQLACDAADRAMQIHGALGYSRLKPFEHIYRHHRRYRITEGADEIQIRRIAQVLFGYNTNAKL